MSVLQCVAVRCSVLQCVALCAYECVAVMCVAVRCSLLQSVAVCCGLYIMTHTYECDTGCGGYN